MKYSTQNNICIPNKTQNWDKCNWQTVLRMFFTINCTFQADHGSEVTHIVTKIDCSFGKVLRCQQYNGTVASNRNFDIYSK